MEPHEYITQQLEEQKIAHRVIQDRYKREEDCPVISTVKRWKNKFVAGRFAPALDAYLWHIFSYEATQATEGKDATNEYLKQQPSRVLIFNEPQQYLIECEYSIPKIEMEDFMDDIYICHFGMEWTYVIPHEIPGMGPYYSIG